jgi:hypothetical protein
VARTTYDKPDQWLVYRFIRAPWATSMEDPPWHFIGGYREYHHEGMNGWPRSYNITLVPICRLPFWMNGWGPEYSELDSDPPTAPQRLCRVCARRLQDDPSLLKRTTPPKLVSGEDRRYLTNGEAIFPPFGGRKRWSVVVEGHEGQPHIRPTRFKHEDTALSRAKFFCWRWQATTWVYKGDPPGKWYSREPYELVMTFHPRELDEEFKAGPPKV